MFKKIKIQQRQILIEIAGFISISLAFQNCSKEATTQSVNSFSDNSLIYAPSRLGIGEPIFENSFNILNADNSIRYWAWDIDQQVDAMLRLRPSIFRMWVPIGYLYDSFGNPKFSSDGSSADDDVNKMKHLAQRFQQAGVPILGMDHSFPPWMSGINPLYCNVTKGAVTTSFNANWNTIPERDLRAGSDYIRFLTIYKNTWQQVASLFPEIQSWEPANETNGALSLVPSQTPTGCPRSEGEKVQFSYEDRVLITIDLMAQAKVGIKAGNPNAVVFLAPPGPVTEQDGIMPATDLTGIRDFILAIYQNISAGRGLTGSQNARDHFDGVSWHPYIFQDPNKTNWIDQNNAIYDVIQSFGDGEVPIIFSEVGNSEYNWSQTLKREVNVDPIVLRNWMDHTLSLSRANFPWLKYLIWFRGIDSPRSSDWGGEGQRRFGILKEWSATDPNIPFQPKPSADTFCLFTNCLHTPPSTGIFKAYYAGVGWSMFWFNGAQYCRYDSAASYQALVGRNLDTDLSTARILDPAEYTYVGNCTSP